MSQVTMLVKNPVQSLSNSRNDQDYQALLRLGPLGFLFHSADVPRAVPQVPFHRGDEGGRSPDLQKHMAVPRKKNYFV